MKKDIKKVSLLFSAILLSFSVFAGCGEKAVETPESVEASVETSVEEVVAASVEEVVAASIEETVEASVEEAVVEEVISAVFEEGELGEGDVQFIFIVADIDGNEQTFTINTNETTVGAALLNIGIIAGDESEYGLYVKNVNGVTADWNVDQTYWAFYIDGEYAMTGVDSTEVVAGSTYKFQISK